MITFRLTVENGFHRFLREVILQGLGFRCTLSLRDVRERLAKRGDGLRPLRILR